jgi:hypothetical protein
MAFIGDSKIVYFHSSNPSQLIKNYLLNIYTSFWAASNTVIAKERSLRFPSVEVEELLEAVLSVR